MTRGQADAAFYRRRPLPFGFDQTPIPEAPAPQISTVPAAARFPRGPTRQDLPHGPPPWNPYAGLPGFEHYAVAGTGGTDYNPMRGLDEMRRKLPTRERVQQISDAAQAIRGRSVRAPGAGIGAGYPLEADPDWLRRYRRGLNQ